MHVCLITETFPPEINGVAMTLSRLASGLVRRGHQVTIIRPRQPGMVKGSCKVGGWYQIPVPGCPIPGYDSLRFGLPLVGRIRRHLQEEKPDVLYIATEGPLGWATARAARSLNLPVASGYHTHFQQYLKHYNLPFLEMLAMGYMRRFHNRTAMTFIPSPDLKSDLEQSGFLRLELLGRGIDTELFDPARRSAELRRSWGVEANDPVVLYVGRLAAEKNLGLMVSAFRFFQELIPESRLVVVGDGPERARLEKECPEAFFTGPLLGEELATHYASADVFLFPSLTETFGNVVTEALASGLVVGAYDYAAPALFIRSGTNGFTTSPSDEAKGFMDMVEQIAQGRDEWPALRSAAREAACGHGWMEISDRFARRLEEILVS